MPRSSLSILVALALLHGCSRPEVAPPRTVLLVSIDTLRYDHLSCHGYGRETSPHIDALAEEAVVFDRAYAQSPYTLPSHMSLLTSLYTDTHGMLWPGDEKGDLRLADDAVTLAESLGKAGFATLGLVDGGFMNGQFGFDQGFDEYDSRWHNFRDRESTLKEWVDGRHDEDLFLFVHTYDVHSPYDVPEPYRSRFAGKTPGREAREVSLFGASFLELHRHIGLEQYQNIQELIDRYDGCISFVDAELAKVFDVLRDAGRYEEAMVVITSDHGESFLDNGIVIGHGLFANEEDVHVPLIIKFPGNEFGGRRVDRLVELVDVTPTILSTFGIGVPDAAVGQNLRAGLERGAWKKDYAFGTSPNTGNNRYLYTGDHKFIEQMVAPPRMTILGHLKPNDIVRMFAGTPNDNPYDLRTDALGLVSSMNLDDQAFDFSTISSEHFAPEITDPEILDSLREQAYEILVRSKQGALTPVRPAAGLTGGETLQQLEALGYVAVASDSEPPMIPDWDAIREWQQQKRQSEKAVSVDFTNPDLKSADDLLWGLWRTRRQQGIGPATRELQGEDGETVSRAREIYRRIESADPALRGFIEWRLRFFGPPPEGM